MNKELALKLAGAADRAALIFSSGDREHNYTKEEFRVLRIDPQETTAHVFFKKSSGKIALGFFYFVNTNGGEWRYFFPTASHLPGMTSLGTALIEVERHNFPFNFENHLVVKQ